MSADPLGKCADVSAEVQLAPLHEPTPCRSLPRILPGFPKWVSAPVWPVRPPSISATQASATATERTPPILTALVDVPQRLLEQGLPPAAQQAGLVNRTTSAQVTATSNDLQGLCSSASSTGIATKVATKNSEAVPNTQCPACTFINEAGSVVCSLCETSICPSKPMGSFGALRADAVEACPVLLHSKDSAHADEVQHRSGVASMGRLQHPTSDPACSMAVACPACTFMNSAGASACAMCETLLRKPEHGIKRGLSSSRESFVAIVDEAPVSKFPKQCHSVDEADARSRDSFSGSCQSSPVVAPSLVQSPNATIANKPADLVQAPGSGDPPLSEKQEWLLNKVLLDSESVFFTGAAGTGKSRTLHELIRRAPEHSTFVTALTGMAATQLPRGTTLHSFSGMGLAKGTKEQCLEHAKSSPKGKRNWAAAKILVIDEASMMSKAFFEKLDFVARQLRRSHLPFGGVILCLCGDFFQLPPVSRGVAGDEARFCFESEVWGKLLQGSKSNLENSFALTQIFRQKDERLLRLLSEVRHNEVTEFGLTALAHLRRQLVMSQGIEPTRLFPTNNRADSVNQERLAALPGGEGRQGFYDCNDEISDGIFQSPDSMDQMMSFPRRLELKVGAQVMLLKNTSQTLVNGSRGVVDSFQLGPANEMLPWVRFLSGESMLVGREVETKDMAMGRRASRSQVPLRLSWAITIHKSQGMSIDFLEVDLGRVFEAGQAYVALSRARTLEGLRVLSFDPTKFWTNPKVKQFYQDRVQQV